MTLIGYYPARAEFTLAVEDGDVIIDVSGIAHGSGYREMPTWDGPGCDDIDLEIESLQVHCLHSKEKGCTESSLYGQEAYDFLTLHGWDEWDLEWENDND